MSNLITRKDAFITLTAYYHHRTPLQRLGLKEALSRVPDADVPRWIPVTDRLPEYGTAVLTINEDDDYEINHIIDEEDGEWFFNGAIAWMPLPEPYKGEL